MAQLRETFADATAAIHAWPDAREAWEYATELVELIRELQGESGDFRGWLLLYLQDRHGLTPTELSTFTGLSRPRISQILKDARERGNPVTDPTSRAPQPPVVVAIITSEHGVLVADRKDKIPPVTFPGGEVNVAESESIDAAAKRRVLAETGVEATATRLIGERIHPMTSRHMIYVHADITGTDVHTGDPEDLENVRWMPIDETRTAMKDMYQPVRSYLDQLQHAQQAETS